MKGQKLFGWGYSGVAPGDTFIMATQFMLTNPDCLSEITINRVSVIKADGTVIYEGPLIIGMIGEELTEPLEPHKAVDAFLPYYIVTFELGYGPENPPPSTDPIDYWPDLGYYTFEVSWTGSKNGLPLTGSSWMATISQDAEGNYSTPSTSAMLPMVNMNQALSLLRR